MNSIYLKLYDFFHAIANYFWHKYINSLKTGKSKQK